MSAPLPANEGMRLEALRRLGILDTPREERFDRLTRLAALALDAPVATISFIDAERQWFKSAFGTELRELPRSISVCAHTILEEGILIVGDASEDARFALNPLVVGAPDIRFYAGSPIHSPDGLPIGSLCVIDFEPHEFTDKQATILATICTLVEKELISSHAAAEPAGVNFSERERTRRELEESESRFRDAFNNAPFGLALIALDGKYLQVNRAMCSLLGYSAEELRRMSFHDITHHDDLAADLAQVNRIRAGETNTFSLEKRYITKRGQIVWVALTSTLIRNANGKARHYIAQMQDITERREAESIKSDFLAVAAHELRSPLASVYGFAELLMQKEFQPEKRQELLTIIHSQARHMTLLINELLDLARIEAKAGRDFTMTPQPAGELVVEVTRDFMLPAGRDPIQLQIAANLPEIRVDREKTQQALRNVLSNAFKYSPQGGPVTLRVTLVPGEQSVAIHVRDNGIGIPSVALGRVFERFFRVGDSTAEGTGLGMTLVKEIIERQEGRVRIESEYGRWTEVTLLLPVAH